MLHPYLRPTAWSREVTASRLFSGLWQISDSFLQSQRVKGGGHIVPTNSNLAQVQYLRGATLITRFYKKHPTHDISVEKVATRE